MAAGAICVYGIAVLIILAIYRLYFSPIAQFPGPKLAALTLWYQFYYDVIKGGQYQFKIRELHSQYGSIIRISPYELHIADPEFYDEISNPGPGRKRDKYEWDAKKRGGSLASISTVEHDTHRSRKAAIYPFFAKSRVRKLQPLIQGKASLILKKLEENQNTGEVLVLNHVFTAFANGVVVPPLVIEHMLNDLDITMEYSFSRSNHRLEAKDSSPVFYFRVFAATRLGHLSAHFPSLNGFIKAIPDWLAVRLSPALRDVHIEQEEINDQVTGIIEEKRLNPEGFQDSKTMFHTLLALESNNDEASIARLNEEAQTTVAAGTFTVMFTLSNVIYYLVDRPHVLKKLKDELKAAIPDLTVTPPLPLLEELPYLSAIIQETLRLGCIVSGRLSRIAREPLFYTDPDSGRKWIIPAGTPMSASSVQVHFDEKIFPDPHTWKPERWLNNPNLNRYLVSFGRGGRACTGVHLAYAELRIVLSSIFRRYGSSACRQDGDLGVIELWQTNEDDVRCSADFGLAFAKSGSKGVRIRVER